MLLSMGSHDPIASLGMAATLPNVLPDTFRDDLATREKQAAHDILTTVFENKNFSLSEHDTIALLRYMNSNPLLHGKQPVSSLVVLELTTAQ